MRYGLIGEKLSHSFSKEIHSHFGDYSYGLFELKEDGVCGFLRQKDLGGLNVTIPYKKTVIPYCDALDNSAKEIGSVNTLIFKDGAITGYNTDIDGFLHMAKRAGIDFLNKKVVILGSGGTSLTTRAAAKQEGAGEIVVVSRSGRDNYENLHLHFDADVVVNTTPVGMYPQNGEKPVSLAPFKNLSGLLDAVYNPLRTLLVLEAMELGVKCASGLCMLVAQAKRASELFSGKKIGDEKVDEVVRALSRSRENIAIVGMPGSGKTSVAAELSKISSREVIDIDEQIEKREGRSPQEILESDGETLFREIESKVLREISKEGGRVISTGGGAVLKKENRDALKQNSRVYFIKRDISLLETLGRPLSKELDAMYEKRLPLYEAAADKEIENDSTVENCALEIWRDFCENSGD